jgi:exosortase A-associated hydrolase 1
LPLPRKSYYGTAMNYQELALKFTCRDDALYGIASVPERPSSRGVLVIVGGPQYRVGSHRQFTLLARSLAEQGFAVLRFDYGGMGDSGGDMRDFEQVDDDLRAAIDKFFAAVPELEEVVIWGLCDGASAALFYANQDPRVSGLVLLNPWARSEQGLAKATLKHYYRARILDPAMWKKILLLRFDYRAAVRSFCAQLAALFTSESSPGGSADAAVSFHSRMQTGLSRFQGRVLLIISGADLTAKEFLDMANGAREWRALLGAPRVTRQTLAPADHTFSRRDWRDQVASWTGAWLATW